MASEDFSQRLADARRRGDADDLAEALALHANALIQQGRIGEAQIELDEAADIHRSRRRPYDEARCTQFAATLCRFAGHLDEARDRCRRALALVESKGPIAVSAFTELGEIAFAHGDAREAADAYQSALDAGQATGLVDAARAAVLRKRAVALTNAGQSDDAVHDLAIAHDLLERAGDHAGAVRALIEQATAMRHSGRTAEAQSVAQTAMIAAREARDHAALADLQLLVAADALDRRDPGAAMAAAQQARSEALASNAPTSYIGAAIAISQIADSAGDRVAAYEALAVGWATLGDLLGPALARATFEPKLKELRERWGAAAFDEVKKTYQERRTRDRGAPSSTSS